MCVHRALAGDSTLAEYYAFCGMHHIFDKHSGASELKSLLSRDLGCFLLFLLSLLQFFCCNVAIAVLLLLQLL